MKKITFKALLLLLITLGASNSLLAQNDFYNIITGTSVSGNGRAPQGGRNVTRSVWIITATEMASAGFVNGDNLSGIGFTFSTAQNIPTTGTAVFYMQNTTDATNTKSTTWATAITGMVTVSNGAITIPNTTGEFNYSFSGGSAFTYSGGGLYIAYDYQNLSNALATTNNVAFCNTVLTGGLKGAFTAAGVTTPPTTLTSSDFRPETRLAIPVACARPTLVKYDLGTSTLTSANVSWNSAGGSNVDIEYGPIGFTLGNGTSYTNVASPYTIDNLSDSSVYSFYVRTNCGTGVYSDWNGPFSFNTTFLPTTPSYSTSFEQESLPFLGWLLTSGTPVGSNWQIQNFGPVSPTNTLVQNGSVSVYSLSTVTTAPANNWFFSRGLNLTSGSTVTVTFYVRNYVDTGSSGSSAFNVTVGNAQTVAAQTTNVGTQAAFTTTAWTLKTYTFTPTFTGVHYLGIQNVSPANATGRQGLFIDNFTVDQVLSSSSFVESKFRVYPNPVKDVLSIENELSSVTKLTISDLNGRVVRTIEINSDKANVNISELQSGIYIAQFVSSEGSFTKKIIKE